MKVIITTSGTGSRLGDFTKYTNKALVNIGNRYSIDLIIDKYKNLENIEFIVTLGYLGDLVKQYLTIAYPEKNITFVNIDKYEGNGSSLGYSLLQLKKYIQSPFYFHCCDCLVDKIPSIDLNNNYLFLYNGKDSSSYASVNCSKELIININEKGEKNFDYLYIGLSYIKDHQLFFNILEELYKNKKSDTSLSDIHVYMKMKDLRYKLINEWYDTGNIKSYQKICENTKTEYDVLIKTNESLSFHKDKVVKFFNDSERNKKRLERTNFLKGLIPEIYDKNKNFHSMELVKSPPISKLHDSRMIKKLLNWSWNNLWKKTEKPINFHETCHKFYHIKTISRIRKCLEEKKCIDYEKVNGLEVGNCLNIVNKVNFEELCKTDSYNFHGDFILDNILIKEDGFCLIDWREDFGGDLENGDIYYDLGKLRHNIYFNHENINNNMFSVKEKDNEVFVDMKCNYLLVNQINDFDNFVIEKGLDLNRIKLITSLIWINMSPLHEYPLSNFLFNFGKYNLFNNLSL